MAFVVTEQCIRCKYTDCVDVCPVDCFHEGENMLVIDPGECIDCGICEPNCPVDAILPDSYPEAQQWAAVNERYALLWPKIKRSRTPQESASDFEKEPGKYAKYFSPEPGRPGPPSESAGSPGR